MADAVSLTRYAYDHVTGAYGGTSEAQFDPMNPGELLEPAFTTSIAPPDAKDIPAGQVAAFENGVWTLKADHRGEIWWKGMEPVQIDDLGDPADQGLAPKPVIPPASPPSSCSKLGLKRAFEEQGLWTTVRAMIAGNADFAEDWGLAIEIRITDPIVSQARDGLAEKGVALSDADVQALVTRATELVA